MRKTRIKALVAEFTKAHGRPPAKTTTLGYKFLAPGSTQTRYQRSEYRRMKKDYLLKRRAA